MTKKIVKFKSKRNAYQTKVNPEFLGKCTMPGCKNDIYTDNEYYKDGENNIFCSAECILEWYGIEKQ